MQTLSAGLKLQTTLPLVSNPQAKELAIHTHGGHSYSTQQSNDTITSQGLYILGWLLCYGIFSLLLHIVMCIYEFFCSLDNHSIAAFLCAIKPGDE
jgi:hypothetical protein